jgi:hypothetical protein
MNTPAKTIVARAQTIIAVALFAVFAAGCAAKEAAPSHGGGPNAGEVAVGTNVPASERSRIVTMDVSITVDRFDDSLARLRAAVDRAGGYVSDLHAYAHDGEDSATIEIRVPAAQAQSMRGSLGELGEVTAASEKVEDVTEQRADLDARTTNAKVQEKRLLEIMAAKSGSIADLVENEKELARVRETIERLEAQQRSLKGKVDLATIHVTLTGRQIPAWKTPGKSLVKAGTTGVNGAQAVATYGTMAFLALAPSLMPIALIVAATILVARRRRRLVDPTAA